MKREVLPALGFLYRQGYMTQYLWSTKDVDKVLKERGIPLDRFTKSEKMEMLESMLKDQHLMMEDLADIVDSKIK